MLRLIFLLNLRHRFLAMITVQQVRTLRGSESFDVICSRVISVKDNKRGTGVTCREEYKPRSSSQAPEVLSLECSATGIRNVWRACLVDQGPWFLAPSGAGMLTLYFGRWSCIMKNCTDKRPGDSSIQKHRLHQMFRATQSRTL